MRAHLELMAGDPDRGAARDWTAYQVYGIRIVSDFRFSLRLPCSPRGPARSKPEGGQLKFSCTDEAPRPVDWSAHPALYRSPYRTATGECAMTLHRLDSGDVLRFPGTADFYLTDDTITCHVNGDRDTSLVELRFLGPVLSYWLEQHGTPALHASAVVVDGGATAFLGCNHGGKSTLAVSFVVAGFPLLSDDILAVQGQAARFFSRPGYPSVRLWPEDARHFFGDTHCLELVHRSVSKRRIPVGGIGFGAFCDTIQPLRCIYIPQHRDPEQWGGSIEILTVSPRDALMELLRCSFASRLVEAAGLGPKRLDFFAHLVQKVPVRRLLYPSGLEHLARVRKAIRADG